MASTWPAKTPASTYRSEADCLTSAPRAIRIHGHDESPQDPLIALVTKSGPVPAKEPSPIHYRLKSVKTWIKGSSQQAKTFFFVSIFLCLVGLSTQDTPEVSVNSITVNDLQLQLQQLDSHFKTHMNHVTLILDHLMIEFKKANKWRKKIEKRMTSIESRMTSIETRMASIESRMTSIESRMTSIESRMTSIETRMTSIDKRVVAPESSTEVSNVPMVVNKGSKNTKSTLWKIFEINLEIVIIAIGGMVCIIAYFTHLYSKRPRPVPEWEEEKRLEKLEQGGAQVKPVHQLALLRPDKTDHRGGLLLMNNRSFPKLRYSLIISALTSRTFKSPLHTHG